MLDLIKIEEGEDLYLFDTDIGKASNIASIQLGSLEYAKDFGVDLKYFLDNPVVFQNESFKTYLVDRLVQNQINVSSVTEIIDAFSERYNFYIGDSNSESEGLIK